MGLPDAYSPASPSFRVHTGRFGLGRVISYLLVEHCSPKTHAAILWSVKQMQSLMLATTNAGKIAEFRFLLGQWERWRGVELLTPKDWPTPLPSVAETGTTFAENARLKAAALSAATGLPALADDSGLCVDALGGEPGLHSARWAGENASDADRNVRLLARLSGISAEERTARYVCVVSRSLGALLPS